MAKEALTQAVNSYTMPTGGKRMKPTLITIESDFRKPGRHLTQYRAEEIAQWLGVSWREVKAPYRVTIEDPVVAGNHFHRKKKEVIEVAYGEARAVFEDPETKQRWEFELSHRTDAGLAQAVAVPLGIAHAIVPKTTPLMLLVWATDPAREPSDDFDYQVVPPLSTPA